jgi:hypothetical protein
MTLRVEPAALRVYARQLDEARKAAETALSYVHKWGDFGMAAKGLIGRARDGHQHFVDELDSMLKHLATLTDSSDVALTNEAGYYEQTDQNSAARFDAVLPGTSGPSGRPD